MTSYQIWRLAFILALPTLGIIYLIARQAVLIWRMEQNQPETFARICKLEKDVAWLKGKMDVETHNNLEVFEQRGHP